MRTETLEYWKHENCVDAFFLVYSRVFDSDNKSYRVWGHWMVQGIHNHWKASDYVEISIKADDYGKWKLYTSPTKERIL